MFQTTLMRTITLSGQGLHSGLPARVVLRPAPAGHGVVFRRVDAAVEPAHRDIPARWDLVHDTRLCTRMRNAAGVDVSTVEHLMAALAGCGVDNLLVEIDGPEVPIMDGSAAPFVAAIEAAGLRRLGARLEVLRVARVVEVRDGAALARLEPADSPEMAFAIAFDDQAIGAQSAQMSLANGAFVHELGACRTFCLQADVEDMRARGLALGGSLENAIVVSGGRVLNPEGLRHPKEYVRHKMLDAVGDLALAGAPVIGRYVGERSGHRMTNLLLRAAFAQPGALVREICSAELAARLPGPARIALPHEAVA